MSLIEQYIDRIFKFNEGLIAYEDLRWIETTKKPDILKLVIFHKWMLSLAIYWSKRKWECEQFFLVSDLLSSFYSNFTRNAATRKKIANKLITFWTLDMAKSATCKIGGGTIIKLDLIQKQFSFITLCAPLFMNFPRKRIYSEKKSKTNCREADKRIRESNINKHQWINSFFLSSGRRQNKDW